MRRPGFPFSFPSRVPIFAGMLLAAAGAAVGSEASAPVRQGTFADSASPARAPEPPIRLAVARLDSLPAGCAAARRPEVEPALFLANALADSLRGRGVRAVADTTLAGWLRRLDATRFPDPGDYRRAREYLAATGAKRLLYVNDLRVADDCALAFEAALWNTEPLGRKAARHGEAPDAAAAAGVLARTLTEWLRGP